MDVSPSSNHVLLEMSVDCLSTLAESALVPCAPQRQWFMSGL